jgi:hypothetical protein
MMFVVYAFMGLTVLMMGIFVVVVFSERKHFAEPQIALSKDPVGRQFILAAKTGFWFWKAVLVVVTMLYILGEIG